MRTIHDAMTRGELKQIAEERFGDMVKGVVDIERRLLAIDAELHSDLEALLMKEGSKQIHLWGINLYPELSGDEFVEFDSMINMRPSQGNRSRGVDDETIRKKILDIVAKRIPQ